MKIARAGRSVRRSLDEFDRLQTFLLAAVGWFTVGFIAGFLIVPDIAADTTSTIGTNTEQPALTFIAGRNLQVALLLLAGGLTFGGTTLVTLGWNGFSFGMAAATAAQLGVPIEVLAMLVVPHAILEIPAFWIAGTVGWYVPYQFVQYLRERKERPLTRGEIHGLVAMTGVSVGLIVLAAGIEVWVTPALAKAVA